MAAAAVSDETVRRGVLPRYLLSALAARMADEGARVSLVLLALDETGSAAVGGAMIAALLIPHVVAAPLVGVVVDRARRPRWVLASTVLIFAGSLFSIGVLLGRAPLWLVFTLLPLGGCCGPAITGGLTSQLPALVGQPNEARAFGLDSLFYNLASMAGPALVGVTAAALSPVAAQSLLAALAALGAAGVATLPIVAHQQHLQATTRPSLLSGAREILHRRTLRLVTFASTFGQLGPGGLAVVAAVLATSLNRPASSGLLLTAVAAGSFVGSLLWTWHPIAPHRSPLVTTGSMIGIGAPLALAAAATGSIAATAVLFGLSGIFIGPFAAALFTARTDYADAAVRTQVFTIGAGLKVTASAFGAALIGLLTGLPIWTQLLLVASSPLLAGLVGTMLLIFSPTVTNDETETPANPPSHAAGKPISPSSGAWPAAAGNRQPPDQSLE